MSVTQFETEPQWQTYLDVQNDVKGWIPNYPTSDTARDTQLQLITDMACQWVQAYLGRPVAPTQFFRRFSGYTGLNGSAINLPYYPVIQIVPTSPVVVEYWGLNSGSVQTDTCGLTNGSPTVTDVLAVPPYVGATVTGTGIPANTTILSVDAGVSFKMSANYTGVTGNQTLSIALLGHLLTEQTPSSQGGPGAQVFQCDYPHGILIRSFQGLIQRPWFPGLRNVEVTWTAGYNPVPALIRTATLDLIKYRWERLQESQRNFPQIAGQGYDVPVGPQLWPSVPNAVTEQLQPYVQVGIG